MSTVALSNIGKSYRARAVLRDVSLSVEKGEFLVLLGPSGCGKSTLLRIIAGLETCDGGEILIDGRRANSLPPSERDIAMVFQSYALYPHKTVFENIALCLQMRRLNALQRLPGAAMLSSATRAVQAGIAADVQRVAEIVGLSSLLDRKPSELSGGQRQRVALARALVRQPRLFLMDEPLSNLDARLRAQMRDEIVQLHRKSGAACIYVTHDHVEAMTMATRIAVIIDGELLQIATPEEIYSSPSDLRVAELIGSPAINVLPGRALNGRIEAGRLHWPMSADLPAGALVQVAFRPEAVALSTEVGLQRELARITHVERLGSESHVHLDYPGHDRKLIARVPAGQVLGSGQYVHVTVDPTALLVFDPQGKRVPAHVRAVPHARSIELAR